MTDRDKEIEPYFLNYEYQTDKAKKKYKMSRPNVQKILYKNVQLVCLS